MNTAIKPAVQQPIDVNYLSKHGLPIRYGNKVEIISGNEVSTWLLNRKLKSQGTGVKKLSEQFINMIELSCQQVKHRN